MKIWRFKLFEKYIIEEGGSVYMVRWRLIETPWFGVFLHHFHRGDSDRHLHDHPWPFLSLILWGGYWEHLNSYVNGFCVPFQWGFQTEGGWIPQDEYFARQLESTTMTAATTTATSQATGNDFALRSAPAVGAEPTLSPFTVVIDSREQAPFSFRGIRADRRQNQRPIIVPTITAKLIAGDYSIQDFEDSVRIERKSLTDLFGTLLWERSRFEKQLMRMGEFSFAAVVIEADWAAVLRGPVERHTAAKATKIGKTVWRSIVAWMVRYPSVQWIPMPTRQHAEVATYRLLERFWKEQQ